LNLSCHSPIKSLHEKIKFQMRRILQLDGLRGLAVLMVFATHAFGVPLLWLGVDLFFVLSGYLITKILLRLKEQRLDASGSSYWSVFYLRRAQRILLPYLIFLACMEFLGVHWLPAWYWYSLFITNIGAAFHKLGSQMLDPLWSLAVEEQFYLLWPLLVLLCSPKRLRWIALSIILASPLLRAFATPFFSDHFPIYCLTIFRGDVLAVGAWIAIAEHEDIGFAHAQQRTAALVAVVTAGIFATLSIYPEFRTAANSIPFNSLAYSLSAIFFGGVVVYSLAISSGPTHALLTFRPLRYLGRVSYTFYLWHVAVLILLERYLQSYWLTPIAAFAATFVLAAFSWKYIESPILNWRRGSKAPVLKIASAATSAG
jgi:peptidoglycan/LPS O-acetylase OafA/YrhL